jgi:hypothetical protein
MTEPQLRLLLTLTDAGTWRVTTGNNAALVFDFHAGTVLIVDDDLSFSHNRIDTVEVGSPQAGSAASDEDPDLGPLLTEAEMTDRLGVGPDTLRRIGAEGVALRVVVEAAYPAFQAVDGQLLPGLRLVLDELAGSVGDPMVHWRWLTTPAEWAGGLAPWELLRDGRVAEVIQAAGRAAWVWRDDDRGY